MSEFLEFENSIDSDSELVSAPLKKRNFLDNLAGDWDSDMESPDPSLRLPISPSPIYQSSSFQQDGSPMFEPSPSQISSPARKSPSQSLSPARRSPSQISSPARRSPSQSLSPARKNPSQSLSPVRRSPSHSSRPGKCSRTQSPGHSLSPLRSTVVGQEPIKKKDDEAAIIGQRHKCDQCSKSYRHKGVLKNHKKAKHGAEVSGGTIAPKKNVKLSKVLPEARIVPAMKQSRKQIVLPPLRNSWDRIKMAPINPQRTSGFIPPFRKGETGGAGESGVTSEEEGREKGKERENEEDISDSDTAGGREKDDIREEGGLSEKGRAGGRREGNGREGGVKTCQTEGVREEGLQAGGEGRGRGKKKRVHSKDRLNVQHFTQA